MQFKNHGFVGQPSFFTIISLHKWMNADASL